MNICIYVVVNVLPKENRIYIRVEFTRKKCKINIKRKPTYEIGWFHN